MHGISSGIALGLHVNAIKAETIFVNDAIHSAVATLSKAKCGSLVGAPVTHPYEQIDDYSFEKRRLVG